MAGLQYHKQAFAYYGLIQQRRLDAIDMKDAGIEQKRIDGHLRELSDLASYAGTKFHIVLFFN